MPGPYDIGDRVTLTQRFVNAAGTLTDPTTVVVTVTAPSGTATTPSTSSSSTGIWTATVDPTESGIWGVRWAGTGALLDGTVGEFTVRRRRW